MSYTLKSGTVISDEDVQRIAEACEQGEYPGEPAGTVVLGRPRLSDEPLEVVSFKVPQSMAAAIRQAAEASGTSRSEFLREAAMERAERVLAEA